MENRHQALGPARERATREWRGRYREEFDAETAYLERVARDVVDQLHAGVRSIHAEITAADAEQRFRLSERSRWEAESRAEHAHDERPGGDSPGREYRNGVIVLS